MKTINNYFLSCDCGAIELTVTGAPQITNYCHCNSCRELLDVPFYAGTAWDKDNVKISKGEKHLFVFKHPNKMMSRYHCQTCGTIVFNTDRFDFRCVSYSLFRKSNKGLLHKELMPTSHQYYGERVVDVIDDLPKYLKSSDDPIFL